MTERMEWGTFKLTEFDIQSYANLVESSKQIGERRGVSTSVVSYHLRKLNDPKVNEALELNSNISRIKFSKEKQPQIEQMIRDGVRSCEIMDTMEISGQTLARIRNQMGIEIKKKKKEVAKKPKPKKPTVIESALSHPITQILTKSFIV